MKKIILSSIFILSFLSTAFAENVEFLTKLTEKIESISSALQGNFAKALFTLIVIVLGLGTLRGFINKSIGLTVIGGMLVVMFAQDLVGFFIST